MAVGVQVIEDPLVGGMERDTEERREILIVGTELVENYTVYIIEILIGSFHWKVKHRYSDFFELHEKLTAENNIDKNLLPPKKMIGKNSKSLVERRQKDLEIYLQTLLRLFPMAVPRPMVNFLHFHLYEIHGIAAVLAEELFHKGEQLLLAGEVFHLKPLQLFAVTQLLRHAKPTCVTGDAKTDLGHIMDFACRLKYLKISGTTGPVGTSNIQEHLLSCDLSIFKSLCQVEMSHCNAKLLTGLTSCKKSLETMSVQCSTSSMMDILVPEAYEFDIWEPEGTSSESPITAVIPKWKMLTTLDLSHNSISSIDNSVKLISQLEYLDLSHNEIVSIENLQHLYNLVHLDLSYNKLTSLDGVYTKVGNIKTLILAGNMLESLRGLNKLYSLVNLDLSNNQIDKLEEIKNIGNLPCLENVNLASNPVAVIPDYRTKVLAQFADRASEVCLDNTRTSEKELDTVEVLKAIQKSKEARDKQNIPDKKMSEESRPPSDSFPFSAHASSSSLARQVSCKKGPVFVDNTITDRLTSSGELVLFPSDQNSCAGDHQPERRKRCTSDGGLQNGSKNHLLDRVKSTSEEVGTLQGCNCLSFNNLDKDFLLYLSTVIQHSLEQSFLPATDVTCEWDTHSVNPDTREDGYFEMGLGNESQSEGQRFSDLEEPRVDTLKHPIILVIWGLCVHLQGTMVLKQFASCVVLTQESMAFFEVAEERQGLYPSPVSLKLVISLSHGNLTGYGFHIPEICLYLGLGKEEESVFILSDVKSLQEFYMSLKTHCSQVCDTVNRVSPPLHYGNMTLQEFLLHVCDVHKVCVKDGEVKGCFPVYLFFNEEHFTERTQSEDLIGNVPWEPKSSCAAFFLSISKDYKMSPSWLLLTEDNAVFIKMNLSIMSGQSNQLEYTRQALRLSTIPLASVCLKPEYGHSRDNQSPVDFHTIQLIMGFRSLTAFFVLPQDKSLFITLYKQLRTSLQGSKNLVIYKSLKSVDYPKTIPSNTSTTQTLSSVNIQMAFPFLDPSEILLQKFSEENHIPFYLSASDSLHFVSDLKGREIVGLFSGSIAEDEEEELRHLMWSPVLIYAIPDLEMTSCVLISTKAVYFLLGDPIGPKQGDFWHQRPDFCSFHMSYYFTIKFTDFRSVNIGLFDQYFRITGPSPDHIVTCLTRDSYSTHCFIQRLMSVLSLVARAPSPEPMETDFYSEFGKKHTGKVENYELIHSSRVKFVYPNEEEIGDLHFIVSEKLEPSSVSQSLNILLYVLGFNVSPGNGEETLLQPKTLILTSSDLFLFNEDYVSYPLPDFAKEPPKKDKYQLVDGRRIRDLDRILMGNQTYPQSLTLVFDDVGHQDFMHSVCVDHFGDTTQSNMEMNKEVQWNIFIPSADCCEKLISLLARQWETLCGRELPVELTG